MPPRTRACKTTKGLIENVGVIEKRKLKTVSDVAKSSRKALADKTNSASDDNASFEVSKKVASKPLKTVRNTKVELEINDKNRPRRERRIPNRFADNAVLKKLSITKENESITPITISNAGKSITPAQSTCQVESPFKTPQKDAETSLVTFRPRRVCRLPSRFEGSSTSPNRFIPVLPVQASTPIVQKNVNIKKIDKKIDKDCVKMKTPETKLPTRINIKKGIVTQNTIKKTSSDSNNNAKKVKTLRSKQAQIKEKPVSKPKTAVLNRSTSAEQKPQSKILSFRVLEDRKKTSIENNNDLDVYEFTYDPDKEPPPPQKKKRKKVVKKNAAKSKSVVKFYYEQNLSRTLKALRNVVAKKPTQIQTNTENISKEPQSTVSHVAKRTNADAPVKATDNLVEPSKKNINSVQVEDIEIEPLVDHPEIDYSPVNSPNHPKTPEVQLNIVDQSRNRPVVHNDPLNLREDFSFFDEQPVASSSMNVSTRHPLASPWRVEFGNLPIRWHVNSYVKPNMTPAVECSYVNFDDNKKKHIYTNLVPQSNDTLPQIIETEAPHLRQPSIISFMKEMAEKSASKKNRGRSVSPVKARTLTKNTNEMKETDRIVVNSRKSQDKVTESYESNGYENISTDKDDCNTSDDKENLKERQKRKNDGDLNGTPTKSPRTEKDITFFGFDESENQDSENVSPVKNLDPRKLRPLRLRTRPVLKEINVQTGPTRGVLPVAVKSKGINSEVANKLYDKMKSATEAPVIPEKDSVETVVAKIIDKPDILEQDYDNEDSQSVHLFEDIEMVHHLKPLRKSYGKAKKVTFRQRSASDSDSNAPSIHQATSSDEHDPADFTFELPKVQQKKTTKKKKTKKGKKQKKQEKEAEAWAAGFNSMCEDIEDFPLVIE